MSCCYAVEKRKRLVSLKARPKLTAIHSDTATPQGSYSYSYHQLQIQTHIGSWSVSVGRSTAVWVVMGMVCLCLCIYYIHSYVWADCICNVQCYCTDVSYMSVLVHCQ